MVSRAAPLSCPNPSCEAGLLPPMQGEGIVLTHIQGKATDKGGGGGGGGGESGEREDAG